MPCPWTFHPHDMLTLTQSSLPNIHHPFSIHGFIISVSLFALFFRLSFLPLLSCFLFSPFVCMMYKSSQTIQTTGDNLVGLWRPSFVKKDHRLFVHGGGGNVTNDLHVLNLCTMLWETIRVSSEDEQISWSKQDSILTLS